MRVKNIQIDVKCCKNNKCKKCYGTGKYRSVMLIKESLFKKILDQCTR